MLLRCEILEPPIQLVPSHLFRNLRLTSAHPADSGGIADIGGCLEGCHTGHSLLDIPSFASPKK
jgi:hypothetical protein